MATEILATGNTDGQTSADFTLGDGQSATLTIKGFTDGTARIYIQIKRADGTYFTIGTLHPSVDRRARVLIANGTFRVMRFGTAPCGVDRD
jgi:hypothetical protein